MFQIETTFFVNYVYSLLFCFVNPRLKIIILDESPEAEPSKLDKHYEYMKLAILKIYPTVHVIPLLFPATTDHSYFRNINVPSFGVLPFELNKEMTESVYANNEKIPIKAINLYVEMLHRIIFCPYKGKLFSKKANMK